MEFDVSSAERSLYIWPESERLREIFSTNVQRFDHSYTMPGLKFNGHLDDAISNKATQLLNVKCTRLIVENTMDGVKKLISAGHLRAAVNITTDILTELGQGFGKVGQPSVNTLQSFKVWACRFQLLMALRMHSLLNEELMAFEELDAPDLYFQYYPKLNKSGLEGTLVPFSLRLVHSESLRFTPYPWESVKRIDILKANIHKIINEFIDKEDQNTVNMWNKRLVTVQKMRARTLYFIKEYNSSIVQYSQILNEESDETKAIALKLMLVRMAISMGDEKMMNHFLSEVVPRTNMDYLSHKSLKSVFYGDFTKSLEALEKIVVITRDNPEIWNNNAICMLYKGQVSEALNLLQQYCGDPIESTMINFFTISELAVCDAVKENMSYFKKNVERMCDMFDPSILKTP